MSPVIEKNNTCVEEREFQLWQTFKHIETKELIECLYNSTEDVRYAAARELQIRGEEIVFTIAVELCHEQDRKELREIGVFILGQLGSPEFPFAKDSIPLLVELFQHDPMSSVRANAAASLGHLRKPIVISTLAQGIEDAHPEVREHVAYALGCFRGEKDIIAPLLVLAKDSDDNVRNWAAFGLRYCDLDDSPIREGLIRLLYDSHDDTRRTAICALAELHDNRVFHALKQELQQEPIFYELLEAAGNLQDGRLLGRLQELRIQWKEDLPEELTIAIEKIENHLK